MIYAGTFSKVLFPGLRVGYVVAAPPLLEKLVLARWNADVTTSVARAGGARHPPRARRPRAAPAARPRGSTRARLDAMLDALERRMPAGTDWTRPRGGHIGLGDAAARAPTTTASTATRSAPASPTRRASSSTCDGRGRQHLALSFANLTPAAHRARASRSWALLVRQLTERTKEARR